MENVDMFNAATAPLTFHDFLDRMRHPQAADLVRSIKSFIVDFMSRAPDPDRDSENVQKFLSTTEGAFHAHPLFINATDEELDSAGEGLEKYLMTKLFTRAFTPLPEDAEHDQRLSEKMGMLQQFIRPEHLDIPPNFHESSWLLAQKELQKINTYKAPRDKLVCILNCCRVINNLLLNVSIASKDNPPGADDFLPVLIYVVIKANPPQLHSNLLYINRYRHHSRLVSEAAYFYTNLVSAESFIDNLAATSLSMDEAEFDRQMHAARASLDVNASAQQSTATTERQPPSVDTTVLSPAVPAVPPLATTPSISKVEPGPGLSVQKEDQAESRVLPVESAALAAATAASAPVSSEENVPEKGHRSVAKLEASGFPAVLEADQSGQLARDYPFLYASAGDLRVMDVEGLLSNYKELVLKYVALCKAVEGARSTSSVNSVNRVSSPLLDLQNAGGSASRTAADLHRAMQSTFQIEQLALGGGDDQAVVKEEQAPEVKRAIESEGGGRGSSGPDLFEGLTLRKNSEESDPRSPSFDDTARQEHPSEFHSPPRASDVQAEGDGFSDGSGPADEHVVAEDTGHTAHEVFKSQDPPAPRDHTED